jgi:thiol-disulfide isomerase/thioredoxin
MISRSKTRRLLLPVVMALVVATFSYWTAPADAGDVPSPPSSEMVRPAITGWSPGQPAASTEAMLQAVEPLPLAIPDAIAQMVEGETALYYFSPTCGHCRAAMPDIQALQGKGNVRWVGVAVGSATPQDIAEFRETFHVTFPVVSDVDRHFATAVGARSTPSVYVVRPVPPEPEAAEGGEEPSPPAAVDLFAARPTPEGHTKVLLTQAFPPFPRGAGPVLLLRSHLDTPFADFQGYQGDVVCRGCHEQEALSMAISHHSVALYTLFRREEHDNPECVSCHVTGMGEPGGFVMGDLSHPLAGVQCEACHGPSGPHDGTPTDARAQCAGCHDSEHSVAFSVEKGLPHIDHYAANGLSEAELRERLDAVATGTAAKPLLAFPEGPSVGAAACKSCHDDIHKSWRKSPHGKAMRTLAKTSQADDPTCVRCHATQVSYGLGAPVDAVANFRTDEAVGCESCHGPGTAHIADPRIDNIVGLGGSCHECVIEAICTGCHTPEWDKTWDLRTRMDALDHHAKDPTAD